MQRTLKSRNPNLSLHGLDDVIGIGAKSTRLYIAPEGAIDAEGGGTSGEALSKAAMKAAKDKRRTGNCPLRLLLEMTGGDIADLQKRITSGEPE